MKLINTKYILTLFFASILGISSSNPSSQFFKESRLPEFTYDDSVKRLIGSVNNDTSFAIIYERSGFDIKDSNALTLKDSLCIEIEELKLKEKELQCLLVVLKDKK